MSRSNINCIVMTSFVVLLDKAAFKFEFNSYEVPANSFWKFFKKGTGPAMKEIMENKGEDVA